MCLGAPSNKPEQFHRSTTYSQLEWGDHESTEILSSSASKRALNSSSSGNLCHLQGGCFSFIFNEILSFSSSSSGRVCLLPFLLQGESVFFIFNLKFREILSFSSSTFSIFSSFCQAALSWKVARFSGHDPEGGVTCIFAVCLRRVAGIQYPWHVAHAHSKDMFQLCGHGNTRTTIGTGTTSTTSSIIVALQHDHDLPPFL